jgi:hypothetical protein
MAHGRESLAAINGRRTGAGHKCRRGLPITYAEHALAEALASVECVIDVAIGPAPEQKAATVYFTAAVHNLHAVDDE